MSRKQWLVVLAFSITYFVWGSTYLANYWAIDSLPPFGMCGVRFLTAGTLLYALSYLMGDNRDRPTPRQWANAGLLGFMFLTVGVGAVVWAQQWVPTSMAALLISFQPLLVMFILWGLFGERPAGRAFLGAGISIVGMALLIGQPELVAGPAQVRALLAVLLGLSTWGLGMTLTPRLDLGRSHVRSTAMQMLAGGALCVVVSFLFGEWSGWSPAQLSLRTVLALSYLVVFGAVLAFTAFNFLMKTVSPEKAATSTYVNPVVAMLLGALLNEEVVSRQSMLAGAILITGVYFINSARGAARPAQVSGESA